MNILIIHNIYKHKGGEESMVELQKSLFEAKGHTVFTYFRNYNEINKLKFGKFSALFASLVGQKSRKEIKNILENNKIDIAYINNIFPLISASILPLIHNYGVEIRWAAHNYRLLCPNGLFYTHGKVCERCCKGVKELNCVINRCEGSLVGSIGYALRNFVARVFYKWLKNIDKILLLTNFQRDKFIEYGISADKIIVTGNSCTNKPFVQPKDYKRDGRVLFVGRLSEEKGVETVIKVANTMNDVEFIVAGEGELSAKWGEKPQNLILLGKKSKDELERLYRTASVAIVTSHCYESFSLIVVEASLQRCPVIVPKLGSPSSIVTNNVTGLHYISRDIASLQSQIRTILNNPKLGDTLSSAAQLEFTEKYNTEVYYKHLVR